MEIVLALGLGIGLASVAGVRAFIPLLLTAGAVLLGFFQLPAGYSGVVGEWGSPVIGALVGLVAVEVVLDKIPSFERVFNIVMVPVRAAAGAVLFVPAIGSVSVLWIVVGAAVAGGVAVLKVVLRPPARDASSGVSTSFLSFLEDVVGVVGGAGALFVPYLPVFLVAFLLFFFSRIRKRRGRKFGGLRILGD